MVYVSKAQLFVIKSSNLGFSIYLLCDQDKSLKFSGPHLQTDISTCTVVRATEIKAWVGSRHLGRVAELAVP